MTLAQVLTLETFFRQRRCDVIGEDNVFCEASFKFLFYLLKLQWVENNLTNIRIFPTNICIFHLVVLHCQLLRMCKMDVAGY